MDYPEIPCLFNRDEKGELTRVVSSRLAAISMWKVTERLRGVKAQVTYNGKSVNVTAEPKAGSGAVLAWLIDKFPFKTMLEFFGPGSDRVSIFGVGWEDSPIYGPGVGFNFFDVYCGGRWLELDEWGPIRRAFEVHSVPEMGGYHMPFPITMNVQKGMESACACIHQEKEVSIQSVGVVCRTYPTLYTADGARVMFKLDTADFPKESVLVSANGSQISKFAGGRGS